MVIFNDWREHDPVVNSLVKEKLAFSKEIRVASLANVARLLRRALMRVHVVWIGMQHRMRRLVMLDPRRLDSWRAGRRGSLVETCGLG